MGDFLSAYYFLPVLDTGTHLPGTVLFPYDRSIIALKITHRMK